MNEERTGTSERPVFPKRAVVTAGMPYGNKELHLGHIGGVFVHADTFTRFLRDRIGKDNVIFVSGTDCYGSPILESYRQLAAEGQFKGTINDFVLMNHNKQKDVLKKFNISNDLFAASSIGRASEIHHSFSEWIITTLYKNGHLQKISTLQFFDTERQVFLNGRQVTGRCPIAGCSSERGYADECSLGHQYMPSELINPISTLSGKTPEMKEVTNWYFKLEHFHKLLEIWVESMEKKPGTRAFVPKSIREFLEPPVIYVKKELRELLDSMIDDLPEHQIIDDENKSSVKVVFRQLSDREEACKLLSERSIRFRTGKTLVPFRLTGNIEWGVPAPKLEGMEELTIWVWPESLWAPVSFTAAYLEKFGCKDNNDSAEMKRCSHTDSSDKHGAVDFDSVADLALWKDWWCSKESKVYQFIGEDNVYFYGPAEMAMFMGLNEDGPSADPEDGKMQLPELIVNNHLLFLDKKASSSGSIKPPKAEELLDYYTAEQLRAHFLGLGLGIRSVGFQPKPFNPKANERDSDPVLKEGNLLSNVFNRAVRSCFYTVQKYYDSVIPVTDISAEILEGSTNVILEYERLMSQYQFHMVMNLLDDYIRGINKYWAKYMREADDNNDPDLRSRVLADSFHMVRTAAVLMHPIAPEGTEMIREYLGLGEEFWSWERIFDKVYDFMDDPYKHKLKFLEPKTDFFAKHPSQLKDI